MFTKIFWALESYENFSQSENQGLYPWFLLSRDGTIGLAPVPVPVPVPGPGPGPGLS